MREGDIFYAAEYEAHRLVDNCGYAAAKRVLAQANEQEEATVFEIIRRRDAVQPDLAPLVHDHKTRPFAARDVPGFLDDHADVVRRYIDLRDEVRGNWAALEDDDDRDADDGDSDVQGRRNGGTMSSIDPEELAKLVGSMETHSDSGDDDDDAAFSTPSRSVSIASTPNILSATTTPNKPSGRKSFDTEAGG